MFDLKEHILGLRISVSEVKWIHFIFLFTGAAVGPLFAGVIESSGWNNVFFMLIGSDIMALLVSSYISYHREYNQVQANLQSLQHYIHVSHDVTDLVRMRLRRIRNADLFSLASFVFVFLMIFILYLNFLYNS